MGGDRRKRAGTDAMPQFEGDGLVFEYSPSAAPGGGPMWTIRCVIDGQDIRAQAQTVNQAWQRVRSRVCGRQGDVETGT